MQAHLQDRAPGACMRPLGTLQVPGGPLLRTTSSGNYGMAVDAVNGVRNRWSVHEICQSQRLGTLRVPASLCSRSFYQCIHRAPC